MTGVNKNLGGGKSLPATAAIRLELLRPGKAANEGSKGRESAAEQSEAKLHRDHPFGGVAERPRARESDEYITREVGCQDKSQPT